MLRTQSQCECVFTTDIRITNDIFTSRAYLALLSYTFLGSPHSFTTFFPSSEIKYCRTTFFHGGLFFAVDHLKRFRGIQCSWLARFFYCNYTIWEFFVDLIFADFQKIAKSAKYRTSRKKRGFTVLTLSTHYIYDNVVKCFF